MSTKHTPAPWIVSSLFRNHSSHAMGFWEATVQRKCETETRHVATVEGGHITIEARDLVAANAALIAASPELLEALKALVGLHDDWVPGGRATRRFCDSNDKAIRTARAVIAKAEEA